MHRLIFSFLVSLTLVLTACQDESQEAPPTDTQQSSETTPQSGDDVATSAPPQSASPSGTQQEAAANGYPMVVMETSHGPIEIELWPDRAPETVENFLRYVDNDLYDGTIFHRVIEGFMIQGGGFDPNMAERSPYPPITNEASADTPNERGTLAMARTQVVDSATAQFFINLTDNDFLNHQNETPAGYGYAVFGQVVSGMDVVDEIATVETGSARGHQDVPLEPVVIESAERME